MTNKELQSAVVSTWSFHGISTYVKESLAAPLMLMYFVMLFINTLLRDTKDTMLVTSQAGVESIPILKSWIVIPCSVVFFLAYSKLSTKVSKKGLFRIIIFAFVSFYLIFGLILYPFKHMVTPKSYLEYLKPRVRQNFHPLLALIEEWPLGLFYVVSELWASAVCQLMFWQVANDVMSINQAKSIYPIIGAMGNLGMVVAGRILRVFADQRDTVAAKAYLRISSKEKLKNMGDDELAGSAEQIFGALSGAEYPSSLSITPQDEGWMRTLFMISVILLISSIVIMYSYNAVYFRKRRNHLYSQLHDEEVVHHNADDSKPNHRLSFDTKEHHEKAKKEKPSLRQSLATLRKSTPLRCAAMLVASYGIAISLVEVSWKGQVKHTFTKPNDYSRFMGSFWTWTGLVSMVFMLMGRAILQRLGYKVAVLFTPTVVAAAGGCFFAVALFQGRNADDAVIAAYSGGFAVLVAKAAKYAFFDATKEIIFIPLDKESQVVGKAAIDVVAYRLSKSGGSMILQVIIFSFGSLMETSGILIIGSIFIVILASWLYTARVAGNLMSDVPMRSTEMNSKEIIENDGNSSSSSVSTSTHPDEQLAKLL